MMNRGGSPNINGAPADAFTPSFPHRLNSEGAKMTYIEAMSAALQHPAFEAKWGDLLRAKHPTLERAAGSVRAKAGDSKLNTTAQDAHLQLSTASGAVLTFEGSSDELATFLNCDPTIIEGSFEEEAVSDGDLVGGYAGVDPTVGATPEALVPRLAKALDALLEEIQRRSGLKPQKAMDEYLAGSVLYATPKSKRPGKPAKTAA